VDLGDTIPVHRISSGYLQIQNSWIFFPVSVTYAVSRDGKSYTTVADRSIELRPDVEKAVKEISAEFAEQKARYIKITAKNTGTCPEWHIGKGDKTWLMVDEVVVE
jgi:hypothetical protein